jgi:hypothetical protein
MCDILWNPEVCYPVRIYSCVTVNGINKYIQVINGNYTELLNTVVSVINLMTVIIFTGNYEYS